MNGLRTRKILSGKSAYAVAVFILFSLFLILFHRPILSKIGHWAFIDENPRHAEAVVVLCSGVEYYPRLIEAAELYNRGIVKKIVINGDRKTDAIRELETRGYRPCCPWYENSMRILELLGVPRDIIVSISMEEAYDTVSEAKGVGEAVVDMGINQIIIITSKYHTRRARFIWKTLYKDRLKIFTVAAKKDPYDPDNWWLDGRQVRWLMAEYGAWIYLAWKNIIE